MCYRDVAAKIDQISCGDGSAAAQGKKPQLQSDVDNQSCALKTCDVEGVEKSKPSRAHRDRKSRSAQVIEFQKITRKKAPVKKEKVTVRDCASLPLMGKASVVDCPTKYELCSIEFSVLQNLASKPLKSAPTIENAQREPVRAAMMYNERSWSSSLIPTHPKRAIDVVEKKKQAPGNSVNLNQQRRRSIRKRGEFGWIERSVVLISRITFWTEFIVKWILNLVVDVSLQIYDVTSYSSGISSVRQIDLRRLLRNHEPEALMWGLEENITLPTTGEEALQRFLCVPRCLDAYGVLGLQASCTEEDVRRHYKRLNALLNPEKVMLSFTCGFGFINLNSLQNPLEGAEEAHELVTKAYQAISTPQARKAYNFTRIRPGKSDLHHEISKLWNRICERVEEARNSMYCDCGRRHSRIALDIRQNEARYCRRCKTRHPARANDIWVETRLCGLFWVYLTCCDGTVYDITEWATCEVNYLKHVRPNSHTVQYRLVSPSRSSADAPVHKQHNEKPRDLADVTEELRIDWGRSGHAQISYLPLEPRDEDRSRRAANRRQKKWR
ncbi:DnaJ domain protein [Trichostrongylus colubriformis]|uniref:DnaJ domain protein n=1 Tax=Trichostrongylus colubriformis TaxID=6319 RepID=A0AAN8EW31_TRICO